MRKLPHLYSLSPWRERNRVRGIKTGVFNE